MNKKTISLVIKLLPIVVIVIYFFYNLLSSYLNIFKNEYEVSFVPGTQNEKVYSYAPEESTFLHAKDFSIMTQDSNTLTFKVPKTEYSKAEVSFKYKNPDKQTDLFLGILGNDNKYNEKNVSSYNPVLDGLSDELWNKVEQGDVTLWQNVNAEQYSSVDAFLDNPPAREKDILTYNYNIELDSLFLDENNQETVLITTKMRGPHNFFTYLKEDGQLDLSFNLEDTNINIDKGGDVYLSVYGEDNKIFETSLEDSAEIERSLNVSVPNLKKGVYEIKLETTQNIVINEIKTNTYWFVVSEKLNVYPEEDVYLLSGNNLQVEAKTTIESETDGFIDNEAFIPEKDKENNFDSLSPNLNMPVDIALPDGEFVIKSNGFFALDLNSAFIPVRQAPNWIDIMDNTIINLQNYKYIIASFETSIEEQINDDEWINGQVIFEDLDLKNKKGKSKFRIYAPSLTEQNKELYIGEINIKLIK